MSDSENFDFDAVEDNDPSEKPLLGKRDSAEPHQGEEPEAKRQKVATESQGFSALADDRQAKLSQARDHTFSFSVQEPQPQTTQTNMFAQPPRMGTNQNFKLPPSSFGQPPAMAAGAKKQPLSVSKFQQQDHDDDSDNSEDDFASEKEEEDDDLMSLNNLDGGDDGSGPDDTSKQIKPRGRGRPLKNPDTIKEDDQAQKAQPSAAEQLEKEQERKEVRLRDKLQQYQYLFSKFYAKRRGHVYKQLSEVQQERWDAFMGSFNQRNLKDPMKDLIIEFTGQKPNEELVNLFIALAKIKGGQLVEEARRVQISNAVAEAGGRENLPRVLDLGPIQPEHLMQAKKNLK